MKIVDDAMQKGPFALLVEPSGGQRDLMIVMPGTGFETKEAALEVAKQYEGPLDFGDGKPDDKGTITVVSVRDPGSLKRFMSM